MPVYRLTMEYDGTAYCGWQWQPNAPTVEGALRAALFAATGEQGRITAAGRTDSGAHAHGQVVGCETEAEWNADALREALNSQLPLDVSIRAVAPAEPAFHARFNAATRTYRYVVVSRPEQLHGERHRDAAHRMRSGRTYSWRVRTALDVEAMRAAAHWLEGTHDFSAFGRSPRDGGSTMRTVHAARIRTIGVCDAAGADERGVIIEVTADAFLYGMMRNFAAAIVAVGSGAMSVDEFALAVTAPHAFTGKFTPAPAHGLHQWRVTYPDSESGADTVRESR